MEIVVYKMINEEKQEQNKDQDLIKDKTNKFIEKFQKMKTSNEFNEMNLSERLKFIFDFINLPFSKPKKQIKIDLLNFLNNKDNIESYKKILKILSKNIDLNKEKIFLEKGSLFKDDFLLLLSGDEMLEIFDKNPKMIKVIFNIDLKTKESSSKYVRKIKKQKDLLNDEKWIEKVINIYVDKNSKDIGNRFELRYSLPKEILEKINDKEFDNLLKKDIRYFFNIDVYSVFNKKKIENAFSNNEIKDNFIQYLAEMVKINAINEEKSLNENINKNKKDYANKINRFLSLIKEDNYVNFFNKNDIRKIKENNNEKMNDISNLCDEIFDIILNKEIDKNMNFINNKNLIIKNR